MFILQVAASELKKAQETPLNFVNKFWTIMGI